MLRCPSLCALTRSPVRHAALAHQAESGVEALVGLAVRRAWTTTVVRREALAATGWAVFIIILAVAALLASRKKCGSPDAKGTCAEPQLTPAPTPCGVCGDNRATTPASPRLRF